MKQSEFLSKGYIKFNLELKNRITCMLKTNEISEWGSINLKVGKIS